ncbi:MAG: hypothetical protein ACRDZO_11265 [Egibacteraceae bacterium]
MAERMVEPSWWADREAGGERRTLIERFQVENLEKATADLRARCQRLERARSSGEVVTVGEVAEVLLGQWSVAFHTRLADSQRALCASGDQDRLARAAQDGRAAAVAVRDRYLAPERISGHSLQQALNLANADASGLRLDRSHVQQLRRGGEGELSEGKGGGVAEDDGLSAAGLGLLPAGRLTELVNPRPADALRARLVANERARRDALGGRAIHEDGATVRPDRVTRRGRSM